MKGTMIVVLDSGEWERGRSDAGTSHLGGLLRVAVNGHVGGRGGLKCGECVEVGEGGWRCLWKFRGNTLTVSWTTAPGK